MEISEKAKKTIKIVNRLALADIIGDFLSSELALLAPSSGGEELDNFMQSETYSRVLDDLAQHLLNEGYIPKIWEK